MTMKSEQESLYWLTGKAFDALATDSRPEAPSPASGRAQTPALHGEADRPDGGPRGTEQGGTKPTTTLPDSAAAWLRLYRDAQARIATAEEDKKLARQHLEQMLGDTETGELDGQPVVRWSFVHSHRLDQRKLKEQAPELVEQCTVPTVTRRFTLVEDGDR